MSILSRLALLFVGVPLLELFILIQLGQVMGLWPTIGLVILTGLAGAALARLEGLRTLWRIQERLTSGQLPGSDLFDGLAILLGGALLLTPGILTDLVGFSFLFPPTRKLLLGRIRRSMEKGIRSGNIQVMHFGGFGSGPGGGGVRVGEEDPPGPPESGEIIVEPGRNQADGSEDVTGRGLPGSG